MVPSIKGNQIILAKKFFTQRFGSDALDKILNAMSENNKTIIKKAISSANWEPEEAYIEFLSAADKVFGCGDNSIPFDCGYYLAKEGIPKIYKIFIRFGDPLFVIQRADRFWSQVHSTGRLSVTHTGPNAVIGRLEDKAYPHKAFCASLLGYFKGILELCGIKEGTFKELHCAAQGHGFCEYAITWNPTSATSRG